MDFLGNGLILPEIHIEGSNTPQETAGFQRPACIQKEGGIQETGIAELGLCDFALSVPLPSRPNVAKAIPPSNPSQA